MNSVPSTSGTGEHTVVVKRVADKLWHALEDDRVVGQGEAWRRLDGRVFVSIDSWNDAASGRLADAMLAYLPRPLYTMVDEADAELTSHWQRAGFTTRRREWMYLVPTDPETTGLGSVLPPSDVTILSAGEAEAEPLRRLDREIREEVEATVGWQEMPAEVLPRHDDDIPVAPSKLVDPSKCVVAAQSGHYVGMIRVAPVPRQPRIGLIAVRAGRQRRGIARALLAQALGALHQSGIRTVSAEVSETNEAAMALFDGIGARRESSNLELVLR
ncbi:GNAT family N-acetyltransferase [Streptomyces fodineus]|uniref:GNAT family N-acetyltransferase n=1 Tax=Streptomyces fodineus TaxID=1904616 RepID=A0A1D7YF30_9ACTN|nr:GNAT family N-acetyltransferase [Streptomyces fodineus]AOR34225.1 GNAT family N-acetyltransferase [Streptomyces fodineus]